MDWFNALLTYFRQRNLSTPQQQKNYVVDVRNQIKNRFGEDHPALQSDGCVRVWSTETWQEVIPPFDKHNAGDNVRGAAFSVDGRWIATASFDRSGFVFNARTGQPLKHLRSISSFFRSAAFAPALEPRQSVPFLLTSHADNRLWDVETETVIGEFSGHDDQVMGAVFAPDGERVATASYDGTRAHLGCEEPN